MAHPNGTEAPPPGGGATGDEVDRIVEAWQRERPDLDPEPLHVFSRISRLSRLLELERRAAFARYHLDGGSFDVLSALRRAGVPYTLTAGRLQALTLVSSGTMTSRIDRLVAAGWVERHTDPGDRRVVQVRLTSGGRAVVDATLADLLARESALLATLTSTQRHQLVALLRRATLPFEA